MLAVSLIAYTYLSLRQAKYADGSNISPATISVSGRGEVTRVPDVASFSFTVRTDKKDPASAQDASAKITNAAIAYLKEQGVADTDIKTTGYVLSPRYKPTPPSTVIMSGYDPSRAEESIPPSLEEVLGYTVDQTIDVKVRDIKKAGTLVAGVGQHGATSVSSLAFIVDDDTDAKMEARTKAVADAKKKAQQLAHTLGVRLVRLTSFWTDEQGPYRASKMVNPSIEGMSYETSPDFPIGENTVVSSVDLTYEIR